MSQPTPTTHKKLLLLIPAYNEESRIGPTLNDYGVVLQQRYGDQAQIVVVLNGCRDGTLGVVQEKQKRHANISYLVFPEPIGKGGALIAGLKLNLHADLIGYVDADGATSPEAFVQLIETFDRNNVDCVIGSRWLPESKVSHPQTAKRRFASRLFHCVVEALFGMGIRDTQCGAKVLKRNAAEAVVETLCLADLAFDVNLLYSVFRRGYRIIEQPTEWNDKSGSHVVFNSRTSLNMLLSLIRLRILYSPLKRCLRTLRPLECWIYCKLNAPAPLGTNLNNK